MIRQLKLKEVKKHAHVVYNWHVRGSELSHSESKIHATSTTPSAHNTCTQMEGRGLGKLRD